MKRDVDFTEISDGKLYELNDLVKADCGDCKGCFACCEGMGNSIVLDPLDCYRISKELDQTFEELLNHKLELTMVEGIIIPNLKMVGATESCAFLNKEGRCDIHSFRPGICRLFPLGRYYEEDTFKYFLQTHECKKQKRIKIKVRNWIDTPDIKNNERFVTAWHYFLMDLQSKVRETQDDNVIKDINMYILKNFYVIPFNPSMDFYLQFDKRLNEAKEFVAVLDKKK